MSASSPIPQHEMTFPASDFFGMPLASTSAPRTLGARIFNHAELDSVRRHLQFASDIDVHEGFVVDDYSNDHVMELPTTSPSSHLVDVFQKICASLTKTMCNENVLTFFVTLFAIPGCRCAKQEASHCSHWRVGIVLPEATYSDESATAINIIYTKHRYEIPHAVLVGELEPTSMETERQFCLTPGPGSSLAHVDDDRGSVSLGGYLRGKTTGKVVGVTVGHAILDKPTILAKHTTPPLTVLDGTGFGHRLVSPSDADHVELRQFYRTTAEEFSKAKNSAEAQRFRDLYEAEKNREYCRYYGESIRAIWRMSPDPVIHQYYVTDGDFCLVSPKADRMGKNNVKIPEISGMAQCIRGAGHDADDKRVYKIGRTTSFTTGRIQAGYGVYAHERLPTVMIRAKTIRGSHGHFCGKGDSGSFVVDAEGGVVGVLVGGIIGKDPRSRVTLLDVGCYVEVTKLLEWAKDVMHEEVEILATP
jgi:hypothetical protein